MSNPGQKIIRWFKGRGFALLIVFIIAVSAAVYDFPQGWNAAASFIESQSFAKGWHIVHFKDHPFRLGLDLQGGTELIYEADVTKAEGVKPADAMASVRDVIERRVNIFGVSEPVVEVNKAGNSWRLNVELAGVKDIKQAIQLIGETPSLDFREQRPDDEKQAILKTKTDAEKQQLQNDPNFLFKQTALNGSYLKRSQVDFDRTTFEPNVNLNFNAEGAKLFEDLTKRNLHKPVAIFLDGVPISAPVVQSVISGGQAVITGNFTVDEAKKLVQRLNAGALPIPIKLISQNTVGATLGQVSLAQSLQAGLWGVLLVALFMIFYYRLSGLIAVIALVVFYTSYALVVFKIFDVTMTLAGIAGFILSLGMAVDANILIFERTKEELRAGNPLDAAIKYGVKRAWSSIRDSNLSTIISAFILYSFTTSFVKGFALTLIIGVLVSMFTAIVVSRLLLLQTAGTFLGRYKWLYKTLL